MAIWIKNKNGDGFITAHTVIHEGKTIVLSEREYDALAELGVEVGEGVDGEKIVRDFLHTLGVPAD